MIVIGLHYAVMAEASDGANAMSDHITLFLGNCRERHI